MSHVSQTPLNPSPPLLRVNTESLPRPRASGHSWNVQTPTSTTSPALHCIPQRSSPSAHLAKVAVTYNANHARDESRKLLGLLLEQLRSRPKPPPIYQSFNFQTNDTRQPRLGQILGIVKDTVTSNPLGSNRHLSTKDEGNEVDDADVFSTDATLELIFQLKEVLFFSVSQGWQIFGTGSTGLEVDNSTTKPTSFGIRTSIRRNSTSGRRSRSPSPIRQTQSQAPELLSRCISVISSVISEDCRFRTSSPKPSRPPNALQSISLDVAQLLIQVNRFEPSIVSRIAIAMIPAFSTFPSEMHPRLLAFFDNVLLRGTLQDLTRAREQTDCTNLKQEEHASTQDEVPTVSIQVEAPDEENHDVVDGKLWQPWSSASSPCFKIQSTNAPLQPLPVYFLSSISPSLMAAILETVHVQTLAPQALFNLCRLVDTLVASKTDAYLDLLEVIAYHTSGSRYGALSLLTTFWPQAVGHAVVSKALPVFRYTDMLPGDFDIPQNETQLYTHDFVPWRFQSSNRPSTFDEASFQYCQVCSSVIKGFGLLCTGCMCAVHFDCYDNPDGNDLFEYTTTSDPETRKMGVHRYCIVPPERRGVEVYKIRREGHSFCLASIFTLPLCVVCRDPIWGSQTLHCTSCKFFAHSSCVGSDDIIVPRCGSLKLDSSHMAVSLPRVRQTFADFHGDIFLSLDDLGKRTYEEISISFATLWTQLQIYNNGLALGSFVIANDARDNDAGGFELQVLVGLYEAYLSSGKLPVSATLGDYLQANTIHPSSHAIMFDWSTLAYISSTIKAPYEVQNPSFSVTSPLLNVTTVPPGNRDGDGAPRHPFEIVPLSHIRDALGYEFNLFSEGPSHHCLAHLHKLGFFCCDKQPFLPSWSRGDNRLCHFPLPLGFDLSADVETLVSAIEACLSELDLSVNEIGLLLLVRRFWPDGLASEYALRRLTRTLLSWIFSEDDNLATILRDFISAGRSLPGIRSPSEPVPWPSSRDLRRAVPSSSVNNGGDYVASRRALLQKYVTRWLLALHDQDISAYSRIVFDVTRDIATDYTFKGAAPTVLVEPLEKNHGSDIADRCLRFIIKLCQASVDFTTFDDLFLLWLIDLEYEVLDEASMPSLQRLLNRDADSAARFSTYVDATLASPGGGLEMADPWGVIRRFTGRPDGLTSGLMWLRLFARSGVEIDVPTFVEFGNMTQKRDTKLAQGAIFVEAMLTSTWLRSMGRQELQPVVANILTFLAPAVQTSLQRTANLSLTAIDLVRRSLSICLLLYGCERTLLLSLGLVNEDEVRNLPSRRRINTRTDKGADPIIVDPSLMRILDKYVASGSEQVTCIVAKFLHSLMLHASLLESYEIDNFVLRNGSPLCACIWQFYAIQHHSISSIRTSLLLRVLVVDVLPFRDLLTHIFRPLTNWESRLTGVARLFPIITDVTSPAFQIDGRQWRSCVLDVFYHCFESMWMDEKEEIRTAVQSWVQTLLPAHLDAIALCWNDGFSSLSVPERLRLTRFLIQLHPYFPTWKTLSWDVIIEALLEDNYLQNNGNNEDGPAAAHLELYGLSSDDCKSDRRVALDPSSLTVSLLLLSLQMMESGIEIDLLSCRKLKLHLAKIIGFNDVEAVPTPSGRAFYIRFQNLENIPVSCYPCIHVLPRILDAPHAFDLTPSMMGSPLVDDDRPCRVLIGTIWVDLVLSIICAIEEPLSLPVLTLKSLLESLMAIIFKHDFSSLAIKHLDVILRKALRKTVDLLLLDISYELRQVALSAIQTYIRRGTAISGVLVVDSIEKAVALVVSLKHNSEDILVGQAKGFIENTLVTLTPSGIFCSLCRRPPSPDFYAVLKSIMQGNSRRSTEAVINFQEELLQSVIFQPPEIDWKATHNSAKHLNMFVETVLYEGVSDNVVKDLGGWMTAMARRASGLGVNDDFDFNTLLSLAANLLRFSKPHIHRDLVTCVETVFRLALSRSNVRKESILLLLSSISSLGGGTSTEASRSPWMVLLISQTILEVLDDTLRMKARATPPTLVALVETFIGRQGRDFEYDGRPYSTVIGTLARSAIYFLQNQTWSASDIDDELAAALAVAHLVLYAANLGRNVLPDMHDDIHPQRSPRPCLTLRAWNILLLAALSDSSSKHDTLLLAQFDGFMTPYSMTLGAYVQARTPPPESAAADIEHAYIALKGWLLLIHRLSPSRQAVDPRGELTKRIWNELWPSFESLVDLFQVTGPGDEFLPLSTAVWSSVANLFIFILQSRSPIAMNTIPHLTLLNRLRDSGRRNSAFSKLTRALNGEALPDIQPDVVISQIMQDVANAEKLRGFGGDPR
ncbi:hypothetical protein PAXRUDRAFT_821994 [Paxillus rubicundulus Ve08.2h10]|uniref:Phorbol-ester/DAG-type domain-containing protein n=1 Tax=Paxillus rubicundulus Ve08.2h10 TaxID=930991 RepID=A0A0D0ECX2_9AGAM|nr:hypothetical protein PAXRUDRAFT_821994 [Paxillus rubicundulus Ve08.2h10]